MDAPKLSPEVIDGGFHLLNRKLKTIREVPKETSKAVGKLPKTERSPDDVSVASASTTRVDGYRVVYVGPEGKTTTFVDAGHVMAVVRE